MTLRARGQACRVQIIVLLLAGAPLLAGEPPNPMADAKAGEWTCHRVRVGNSEPQDLTTTVKKVTDAQVVCVQETGGRESTFSIARKEGLIDQIVAGFEASGMKVTIGEKKISPDAEKIEAGGANFSCTKVSVKGEATRGGDKLSVECTYWIDPKVPLMGIVRSEKVEKPADGKGAETRTSVEIVKFGDTPPKDEK